MAQNLSKIFVIIVMPYNRLIPVILLTEGGIYKTRKFNKPIYIGDPINTVKLFNELEADELIVLDFMASKNRSYVDFEILSDIASEAFMPLSYGGGITSESQVSKLFKIGYEKVVLNTSFLQNPEFVKTITNKFGSQAITISIDYKKDIFGRRTVFSHAGVRHSYKSLREAIDAALNLNVGEVFVNCVSNDGEMGGIDKDHLIDLHDSLSVPIIGCGGLKDIAEVQELFDAGVEAVAGGALFVFKGKQRGILISYPSSNDLHRYNK